MTLTLSAAALMPSMTPAMAQDWQRVLDQARGQTVFFTPGAAITAPTIASPGWNRATA